MNPNKARNVANVAVSRTTSSTLGRDHNGWRSGFLATLLVLSSLLIIPGAMPAAQAAPWGGSEPTPTNLTVFLHNSTSPLPITGGIFASEILTSTNDSARPWRGGGVVDVGLHFLTVPFYLFPRVAGPLTLNGTPVANVFVNQTGSVTTGSWTMTLYSVDPSGVATQIGTPGVAAYGSGYSGSLGLPIRIVYGSPLLMTLPTGWSLEAVFDQSTGATSDHYGFWWGDVSGTYYPADINVPASTYLAVNQTYVVGPSGVVTNSLNTSVKTPIASLRANFSDPLGNYDYTNWTVNWTVTNLGGALYGAGKMTAFGPAVPPSPYGFNETYAVAYNYSWLPSGGYTFCANGTDNTNHNDFLFTGHWFGRAAQGCTGFFVGSAPNLLTLRVLDSKHVALAGARVVVASILNFTNATGITHFRLSNGTYTGTVTWEGIVVANPSITVSGPTSITVVTRVYYPTFTVEDQASIPLSNALVYIVHPNGTQYPLMVTGSTGTLNLTQVPGGAYGLTVIWHGSVVYAQPAQPAITVSGNVSYPVVTQVYYQSFQVVTPGGAPLALASVLVENSTTGLVLAFGITNTTGVTTARVPAGTFTVLVYWQTSLVATVPDLQLPAATNPYVITVSLFQVSFLALDSKGIPVADAEIAINSTGGPITTLVTSSAGTTAIELPGGTYTFTTRWEGIVVDSQVATISAPTALTLNLAVYYLTLTGNDASGAPVGSATVVYTTPQGSANGTLLLGANGSGTVRLPGATYSLSVFWEGILVGTASEALTSSTSDVLSLSVYYLTFQAQDAAGIPVSAASIRWTTPQGQANGSVTTGAAGTATVRLPGAPYSLTTSWEGVLVNTTSVSLGATATVVLHLAVYYLTFAALDAKGIPVVGASVSWIASAGNANGSLTSNGTGTGLARLPGTAYTVTTTWEGVQVNQTTYTLASSTTLALHLAVYYLVFQASDAKGIAVGDASLALSLANGPVSLLLLTATNGSAVARVPTGSYAITVNWDDVTVYQGTTQATADANVPLALQVYYLTVDTVDKGGSALPGVFLQVLSTSTGAAVASATTTSQATVFRLPVGSYAVVGTYKSTYDLTPVEQTLNQSVSLSASSTVTLKFTEVNPAFTSTNEFYAIAGFVLLGVLLLLLAVLLLRRRKGQEGGKPAPAPSSSTEEAKEEPATPSSEPAEEKKGSSPPDENWKEDHTEAPPTDI